MKTIKLSNGMSCLVDDLDFDSLNVHTWNFLKSGGYARRASGGKDILMHRVILNAPQDKDVDHINGNGLDNRRSNIRICSTSENMRNRKTHKNNKCGVKGVRFHKKVQKWDARIQVNKKPIHLGYFDTVKDASDAYNQASKKFHGEFGRPSIT